MLHSLTLPRYDKVKDFEGLGNYAIKRYYQFPFSFFYCKKLKMILKYFEKCKVYHNILDFGSGKAEIFREELQKHALSVKCVDKIEEVQFNWRFNVIVCASVLEFTHLPVCIQVLRNITEKDGMILGSSPMDTWLSRMYFKLIGDKNSRHSHKEIMREIRSKFFIIDYKEWFGLYFSFKAYPI